ncbi:MAG: hypothetical protein F2663_06260 [Actinobacteria bacterium]|uniref:Unannotated protein n=1 Tax=freshwater metagenome TaxID=449393 RepID=A0A6J6PRN2_9ZZZZ|nr:hypothetical protein [Actinomycetota bacterium]
MIVASTLARLILLLPVWIVGIGIVVGTFILLGRALVQSIRESGHPRLVVGCIAGVLLIATVLTILDVHLPSE